MTSNAALVDDDFATRPTEPPPPAPTTIPAPPPSDGLCEHCEGSGLVLVQEASPGWWDDGVQSVTCGWCLDGRSLP